MPEERPYMRPQTNLTATTHGSKIAATGRKRGKRYSNKKHDKFRKAQAKRG